MITSLEIQNFKCFKHLRLSFGALTLLTGFNASGKSSAIQPLLLLSQGLRSSSGGKTFALNGPLVRLGGVGDILPSDSNIPEVSFGVAGASGEARWAFRATAGERFLRTLRYESKPSALTSELARLTYISAVREGTADAFPLPDVAEQSADVGSDGRFAAYQYDRFVDEEVPALRRHPSQSAASLRKQMDAWLSGLFPGAQVNVQFVPQMSQVGIQFRLSDIGNWRRPANVGYGLTYAFPILVALLISRENDVVVIDSPEAHLHPSAQSQMGRLLATFAASGVQILIETHSDHLLNGARLAVKEKILTPNALQIHFFTGAHKAGHGVVSPAIDSEGRISDWPDGFFDQSEKDLSRLSGWA